jgi:hypothetical protein
MLCYRSAKSKGNGLTGRSRSRSQSPDVIVRGRSRSRSRSRGKDGKSEDAPEDTKPTEQTGGSRAQYLPAGEKGLPFDRIAYESRLAWKKRINTFVHQCEQAAGGRVECLREPLVAARELGHQKTRLHEMNSDSPIVKKMWARIVPKLLELKKKNPGEYGDLYSLVMEWLPERY